MGLMDTLKKTVVGEEKDPADADILDTLKQEHDDVAEMLDRLVESTGAAERRKLLEKVVYQTMRGMRGKEQQAHAEEGFMEHALVDRMLAQLGRMTSPAAPEFSAGAKARVKIPV